MDGSFFFSLFNAFVSTELCYFAAVSVLIWTRWYCDANDSMHVWSYIHTSIHAHYFLFFSFSFFPFFFFCFAPMCSSKKFLSMSALSPFWRKAVGCNFPPIFGMTLSGPVGIDAPVSHHAAGGMINNKHWWILHCPCGFCHYLAAPKYHLQL